MRLNEKTYPAFFTLLSGNYEYLKIDSMFSELLDTEEKFKDFMFSLKYIFRQINKKYFLTNTFKDSIITAMPKIVKENKHYDEIPCDCGVIFTDFGFSVYLSNPTDKKVKFVVYGFTRDVLTTYGVIDNDFGFGGVAANTKDGVPTNDREHLAFYLNSFLVSLYFIHNCEIDTKLLKPKEKFRENGNKHYNESNQDVIILDCKWFTELVRSIPFSVKGHYRWQVHGEKFSKRKLIWISDFEKSGYVRKAGKEIHT